MAQKQEIELFISEDGELKVHIRGIKGTGCLNVLERLAQEMGPVKSKELTGEYYQAEVKRNSQLRNNTESK